MLFRSTLDGGTFFQIYKTAPPHQVVLWHQRERREDPDLDRSLHLRTGCDRPEAPATGSELLPNSTVLSLTLFEKIPILWALEAIDSHNELGGDANQLILFEF